MTDETKLPAGEHPLIVFAGREHAFKDLLGRHLRGEGLTFIGEGPDANLYVLWGPRAGTPVASATFDRTAGRIIVDVKWTGTGMMKDQRESNYAGLRFELGDMKPGTVGVWVRESTAVDKDPKLTKSITFTVTRP